MATTLARGFYKLRNSADTDSTLKLLDNVGCCDETDPTITTYTTAATDVAADPVASIDIDGTTYAFTASAATALDLQSAIVAAFATAGYEEVSGAGVVVTGGDNAAVVEVRSSVAVTQITTDGAVNVAFA